ncbi:MAG: glutaminyl-peptide cyclotransferase [Pseudomonadota bacterium]
MRLSQWLKYTLLNSALVLSGCETAITDSGRCQLSDTLPTVPSIIPRVVKQYPHDKNAFTQGLAFANGKLYEGTGRKTRSGVRIVNLETGRVEKVARLSNNDMFGEGITIYGKQLIQLTWLHQTGYVYDADSLALLKQFSFSTEQGWGLTHNGEYLIMSDGSSRLYFLDPSSFQIINTLVVREHETNVERLNELEYINGELYANVWKTSCIARISLDTGQVVGWLDLHDVVEQTPVTDPEGLLNGIAHDVESGRIWITGKLWPYLFEIEF